MPAAYALIICVTLAAVDGGTIRCNGESMRLLGDGDPHFVGIDAPEFRRKCKAEVLLAHLAKRRLAELLKQEGVTIEDSGERDSTRRAAGSFASGFLTGAPPDRFCSRSDMQHCGHQIGQ